MPGTGFKKVANEMRKHLVDFINVPFDMVRTQMVGH
jgi:hypothetical protein